MYYCAEEAGSVAALTSLKHVKSVDSTIPVNLIAKPWLAAIAASLGCYSQSIVEVSSTKLMPTVLGGTK
jgi:hypothetical protein